MFHLCIRRSPNCPMPTKRAMRTVNAVPNFRPMRLVFNANSFERPLRPGQGLERRILQRQPRETKNKTAATPIQTRLLLNAALNFRRTFWGEIDDGLGTAQGVLSQVNRTPARKVTIVTKGGQRTDEASSVRFCAE